MQLIKSENLDKIILNADAYMGIQNAAETKKLLAEALASGNPLAIDLSTLKVWISRLFRYFLLHNEMLKKRNGPFILQARRHQFLQRCWKQPDLLKSLSSTFY